MSTLRPEGILTALVTPFQPNGAINWDVVPRLVDHQLRSGVSGLAVTAGAGEYISLHPEERAEIVRRVGGLVQGRVPVIAGILAPDTTSAIKAGQAARDAGAQALLLLTPYYISPSPAGLVEHFRLVASATELPIVVYNNPGRTGINLELPVLERLAELSAVVGIKECDRDLGRVSHKINRLGSRLAFLCGEDDLVLPFLSVGGRGAIMASTNLIAPWAVAMFEAIREREWSKAHQIFFQQILPFVALYKGPDHPGPLKQAMVLAGFDVGMARPPLQPLDDDRLRRLSHGLKELGLMKG